MKYYFYLINFIILISGQLYAQDSAELLIKIQQKFRTIEYLTADFQQIINSSSDAVPYTAGGKFGYGRGNKFYMNMKEIDVISDGTTIWNSNRKLNRVVINNIADDPGAFSLEKYILEYPAFCNTELETGNNSFEKILILTPDKKDLGFKKAKLWTNENNLVTKFEITDQVGNNILIELKNIKINVTVNQELFTFNPPEGIQIIDLR